MGKNDAFSSWLKEFCILVFTQTIQAFIFAIIILLIIKANSNISNEGVSNQDDSNAAVAFVGIIGLASIGKIEDLVKGMIGFKSNVHDSSMRGGLKSFATGMAVASMVGKRVGTNVPNFAKGIKGAITSRNDVAKENKGYSKKLTRMGITGETQADADNINVGNNPNSVQQNNESNKETNEREDQWNEWFKNQGQESLVNAKGVNGVSGTNGVKGVNGVSGINGINIKSDKAKWRLEDMEDAHNKRLSEIKDKRREGIKGAASSVLETGGALVGATAGLSAALATGDVGTMLKAAGVGATIGDAATGAAVSSTSDLHNYLKNDRIKNKKEIQITLDKQQKQLDEAMKKIKDVSNIN